MLAIVQNLNKPGILVFTSKQCRSHNCVLRLIPVHNIHRVYVCTVQGSYWALFFACVLAASLLAVRVQRLLIWLHTCMHAYRQTYIHACLPTYIHTYLPTYMHAYIHTCIYIYTYYTYTLYTYNFLFNPIHWPEGWPHRVAVAVRWVQPLCADESRIFSPMGADLAPKYEV